VSVPAWLSEPVDRAVRAPAPGVAQQLVLSVLSAAAAGYGAAIRLRGMAYRRRLLRTHRLDCRVICVGNLTVGGTGKTPAVITLARAFAGAGRRVAILLRGYGGAAPGPLVVSDGHQIRRSWRDVGDEAVLLAQSVAAVPVIVGGDRVAAGEVALREFRPETLLLDDGFQHRRLHRDLDLVLLDATDPFGGGRLLPRGRLREPMAGLGRADAILITRADQAGRSDELIRSIGRLAPGRPIALSRHRAEILRELGTGLARPLETLHGRRVLGVTGIAKAEGFFRTLEETGARLAGRLAFPDHHPFSEADQFRILGAAEAAQAEWIVTTEKDAVRLAGRPAAGPPVLALGIRLEIREGRQALEALLGISLSEVVGG